MLDLLITDSEYIQYGDKMSFHGLTWRSNMIFEKESDLKSDKIMEIFWPDRLLMKNSVYGDRVRIGSVDITPYKEKPKFDILSEEELTFENKSLKEIKSKIRNLSAGFEKENSGIKTGLKLQNMEMYANAMDMHNLSEYYSDFYSGGLTFENLLINLPDYPEYTFNKGVNLTGGNFDIGLSSNKSFDWNDWIIEGPFFELETSGNYILPSTGESGYGVGSIFADLVLDTSSILELFPNIIKSSTPIIQNMPVTGAKIQTKSKLTENEIICDASFELDDFNLSQNTSAILKDIITGHSVDNFVVKKLCGRFNGKTPIDFSNFDFTFKTDANMVFDLNGESKDWPVSVKTTGKSDENNNTKCQFEAGLSDFLEVSFDSDIQYLLEEYLIKSEGKIYINIDEGTKLIDGLIVSGGLGVWTKFDYDTLDKNLDIQCDLIADDLNLSFAPILKRGASPEFAIDIENMNLMFPLTQNGLPISRLFKYPEQWRDIFTLNSSPLPDMPIDQIRMQQRQVQKYNVQPADLYIGAIKYKDYNGEQNEYTLDNVNLVGNYKNGLLDLQDFKVRTFDGNIRGNGYYHLSTDAYAVALQVSDMDLAELLGLVETKQDSSDFNSTFIIDGVGRAPYEENIVVEGHIYNIGRDSLIKILEYLDPREENGQIQLALLLMKTVLGYVPETVDMTMRHKWMDMQLVLKPTGSIGFLSLGYRPKIEAKIENVLKESGYYEKVYGHKRKSKTTIKF